MSYITRVRSRLRGREGAFWQAVKRANARALVYLARRYELDTRQKGRPNGNLGVIGLEVMALFAELVDERTGRLDPSLDFICARLKRSKDAVVRAIAALCEHGFLEKMRRWKPSDADGWSAVQTSNAYRLTAPEALTRRLANLQAKPPMPDDEADRLEQARADTERFKRQLTCDELTVYLFGTRSTLGNALRELAKSFESAALARVRI